MNSDRASKEADCVRRPPTSLDRRTLLRAAGALALAPAVAGCVGGGDAATAVGERPAYSRWIGADSLPDPEVDEAEFLFSRADFRALRGHEDGGAFADLGERAEAGELPLVIAPLYGAVTIVMVSSLGLLPYGPAAMEVTQALSAGFEEAGSSPTQDGEPEPEGPAHRVDTGFVIGDPERGALLGYEGAFDVDAFEENVPGFEAVDDAGGFTIYEGLGDEDGMFDTSGLAFAVGEDAVLFPLSDAGSDPLSGGAREEPDRDPRALLGAHIDVYSGEAEEAADADEDFDWSLRAGGAEDHVLSGIGLDDLDAEPTAEGDPAGGPGTDLGELDALLRDAKTFTVSTSFVVEAETIVAAAGFVYPDESERPEESDFEALAPTATDASIDVDGRRVRVEAEWTGGDGEDA